MAFRPGVVDLPITAQTASNAAITVSNFGEFNAFALDDMDLGDVDVDKFAVPEQWTSFEADKRNVSREADITLDSTPRRQRRRRDSFSTPTIGSSQEKWNAFEGFGDEDEGSSSSARKSTGSTSSIEIERARAAAVSASPQPNVSFNNSFDASAEILKDAAKGETEILLAREDDEVVASEPVESVEFVIPLEPAPALDDPIPEEAMVEDIIEEEESAPRARLVDDFDMPSMDVEMVTEAEPTEAPEAMVIEGAADVAPLNIRMRPIEDVGDDAVNDERPAAAKRKKTEKANVVSRPAAVVKAPVKRKAPQHSASKTEISSNVLKSRIADASALVRPFKKPRLVIAPSTATSADSDDNLVNHLLAARSAANSLPMIRDYESLLGFSASPELASALSGGEAVVSASDDAIANEDAAEAADISAIIFPVADDVEVPPSSDMMEPEPAGMSEGMSYDEPLPLSPLHGHAKSVAEDVIEDPLVASNANESSASLQGSMLSAVDMVGGEEVLPSTADDDSFVAMGRVAAGAGGSDDLDVSATKPTEDKLDQRTAKMLKVVRKGLKRSKGEPLNYASISAGSSRHEAAAYFFEVLQLKSLDFIDINQSAPYGDIFISPGSNY